MALWSCRAEQREGSRLAGRGCVSRNLRFFNTKFFESLVDNLILRLMKYFCP